MWVCRHFTLLWLVSSDFQIPHKVAYCRIHCATRPKVKKKKHFLIILFYFCVKSGAIVAELGGGKKAINRYSLTSTWQRKSNTFFFFFTLALFKTSHLKCIIHDRTELYYCAAFVWIINSLHTGVAGLQKGVYAAFSQHHRVHQSAT